MNEPRAYSLVERLALRTCVVAMTLASWAACTSSPASTLEVSRPVVMPPPTPPMVAARPVASAGVGAASGAGSGGAPAATGPSAPAAASASSLLPAADPGMTGPWQVQRQDMLEGLPTHTMFLPSEPATHGKYLVVVWTCGEHGTVDFYKEFLKHIASHGFLVIAGTKSSNRPAVEALAANKAIDWLVAENSKQGGKFFEKIDLDRIAVMGHSLGSEVTFGVAATNPRVRTSMHYAGGLTDNVDGVDQSSLAQMTKPAAFVCGSGDTSAGPSCATDYGMAPKMLPVFYGVLMGADHVGPFRDEPRAGEFGRVGVGWLRFQLADDTSYKQWFAGAGCGLCTGPWKSFARNLQ